MAQTPIPWTYFVGNTNGRGLIRIEVDGTGEHIASMPRGAISEARAAFIVRAVNSHAALIEALEWALMFFDADFEHAELDKARVALSLAKGL